MLRKSLTTMALAAITSLGLATIAPVQAANTINGAGSTFVYPILAKWPIPIEPRPASA